MDWTILKVFIEFVTILLLFYVLVFWLWSMWDLSSLTRDQICTPALEGEVLNTGPPGKFLRIVSDAWYLQGASSLFLFWKHYMNSVININADGDCNHEIKRCLLLGRKAMTNLDSILKSRDITLPTKFHLVKAMVLPVVMCRCESWTIKKAECQRIDAFELWCWRRLLRVPWTARRWNQSLLKEIGPEYHWKDWCWSWNSNTLPTWCEELTHWKRPWCWERLKAGGEEGDDREWDGWITSPTWWTQIWAGSGSWWWQGGLVCCSPWSCKEVDTTEWLNWTD